jgi:hypothetical protein
MVAMRIAGLLLLNAVFWGAALDDATRQLSRDIFRELIEINTTDSVGSTTLAAEAMAKRLKDAGFPAGDVHVLGPNDRKGNMVARLRGTGARKPVLMIGHLDVVEARREDWTTNPFQFVEKDGYFYGRGTQDMKVNDAILVTTFIRFRREGYRPDRDLILALTADTIRNLFREFGMGHVQRRYQPLTEWGRCNGYRCAPRATRGIWIGPSWNVMASRRGRGKATTHANTGVAVIILCWPDGRNLSCSKLFAPMHHLTVRNPMIRGYAARGYTPTLHDAG